METKEFEFKGFAMNGFIALFVEIALVAMCIFGFACSPSESSFTFILSIVGIILAIFIPIGFRKLEPNEAMLMLFFGVYKSIHSRMTGQNLVVNGFVSHILTDNAGTYQT